MKNFPLKYIFFLLLCTNCNVNYGQLKYAGKISDDLEEVSGMESIPNFKGFWMINDGGNDAEVYEVNMEGKIFRTLYIDGKNRDWEDLTKDDEGNLYIGDFGNNSNDRKNLKVYKLDAKDMAEKKSIDPEKIKFSFPNQKKFPPKKKERHFDVESFFYHNGYLYLFTKSRTKSDFGRSDLYKIPAEKGEHEAEFLGTFHTCSDEHCWVTSAAISPDGKKVVLLSHNAVWQFTDFKGDDFFNGTVKKYDLGHTSQKESICFTDNTTVYIADEESHGSGRNLYRFTLD
ncbi:hypothetical protein C8N46_101563 [Kordia periserrulae]|uniref:WD40 repeat protein n=1 Tax=Kordia periserrulae TaxID=701523 RepID=A0A2T6C6M4_9FLAO|nr:hypothetical protein [Kordia periserrulae]PTX63953.1 hypothetical protein C8N46_101563 [Kordia periserrulae]